jgi:hypothetical protein
VGAFDCGIMLDIIPVLIPVLVIACIFVVSVSRAARLPFSRSFLPGSFLLNVILDLLGRKTYSGD